MSPNIGYETEVHHVYEKYEEIVRLLAANSVPFTIHEHIPSYTFADAKEYLHFPLERLLKTVAFKVKTRGYVLAAVRGPDHIDYRKLAAACGTKRTQVIRLTPEEVTEVFEVEVGSVSPIVSPEREERVKVFFDNQVPTQETVFCGIGRPDRTLEIRLVDLAQITRGQTVELRAADT
jgi:Cys-tRNA(Pro)/Cys-tRNA(Cys) deacylase